MRELQAAWIDLVSASRTHLQVRLVAVLGAVLFCLAFALAGGGAWPSWVGLVVLGAAVVLSPTGLVPVVFALFAIASWWMLVDGPWHWALLPAALGLLLVHSCAALAASVPAQAPLPRSVVALYLARVGVVAALTLAAWLLTAAIAGIATGAGGPVPGILGLAVLVVVLVAYVRRRPLHA